MHCYISFKAVEELYSQLSGVSCVGRWMEVCGEELWGIWKKCSFPLSFFTTQAILSVHWALLITVYDAKLLYLGVGWSLSFWSLVRESKWSAHSKSTSYITTRSHIYPEITLCFLLSVLRLDLASTYSECWTDLWLPSIRIHKEITVAQQINYGLSPVIIIFSIFIADWLGRSWKIYKYGSPCFADRKTVPGTSSGL